MTDQRFKYYTGYEVDNEPSDDEEDNAGISSRYAITEGHRSSESSDEEFDRPIREYVEKAMSQSTTSKGRSSTKQSDTFEKEMEDELDQIYHNFISRGTFELPITTQKSSNEKKTTISLQEANESESDDEVDADGKDKDNDDLLYDPDEEEEDEKWMINQRIKSQGGTTTDKPDAAAIGPTDAVLNCPGCMVLICHDCQRHETIKNQYRAMFVFNCKIDENRLITQSKSNAEKSSRKKRNHQNKRFKSDPKQSGDGDDDEDHEGEDILRPVLCSECGTEVGVYEAKEELYHFANVLASH